MDFRLDFNLQHSALISWSGWFWNRPDIKDKIKDLIDHEDLENLHHKESFRDLVEVAKGYLKAVSTPRRLYDLLVKTIIAMGVKAIKWYYKTTRERSPYYEFRYLREYENVSIPFGYTKALHWTVFGTVDEAKIVENSWIEKLETLQNDQQMCDIYYMACTSTLKDFINSNAEKMLSNAEKRRRTNDSCKWNFIACSVLTLASPEHLSEERKIELISEYFTVLNVRKEAYMFSLSVSKGHFIATRYYWQQLNSSEREEMITQAARICFRPISWFPKDPYTSRFPDVLVFLLSEVLEIGVKEFFLTDNKRIEFFKFRIEILYSLIRSCGWENYFFPVFDLLRSEMTECSEYYCVLKCIIDTLQERRMMGLDSKNTIYHQMLSVVLSDGGFEVDTNLSSKNNSEFVPKVFELFDLDVINMILEKYSDCRMDFLSTGKMQYAMLIRDKKFNVLREIMETVLKSEEEREWFRSCQIDPVYDLYAFIREDAFHLADNLLNILASSEEERRRIKHKMDFLSFTAEFFSKGNLIFAQKILDWGFSDEKEKNDYFNTFKCPGLIYWGSKTRMSHFLIKFWRKHLDKKHFILSLSEFLSWFCGSENAGYKISNNFSETLLRNFFVEICEVHVLNGADCVYVREAFEKIDELIKFCVPLEDIPKLRTEITQNACKWLTDLIFPWRNFGGLCWGHLDSFLDWVLEYRGECFDYEKKREFVKNLFLTRDGLMLFRLIVSWFNVKDYLCFWIEWAGGISKVEELLYEVDLSSDYTMLFEENFQRLKKMFEIFESGNKSLSTPPEHSCCLLVSVIFVPEKESRELT